MFAAEESSWNFAFLILSAAAAARPWILAFWTVSCDDRGLAGYDHVSKDCVKTGGKMLNVEVTLCNGSPHLNLEVLFTSLQYGTARFILLF